MTSQEAMGLFEQRGEQRGELRGILQGRRMTVLRQLRRKFGEIPEKTVARIQAVETTALEQIEDKLLFAKTLDEVFVQEASGTKGL